MKTLISITLVALLTNISVASARDTISIVGSSTVYPFSTVVAERFSKSSDFNAPKVESTGSGGGLKLFCSGVGVATPDITNASRRIKSSEFELCQQNGVKEIVEVLIGYDGIVLANAKGTEPLELSRKDIYMALAASVPGADGKFVANPYTNWNEINSSLPAAKIEVLGPPPTSGTRDAFAELALEAGAEEVEALAKLSDMSDHAEIAAFTATIGLADAWKAVVASKGDDADGGDLFGVIATSVREDGAYIEAGENDNLIVNKLTANPSALGIFGFSFLDQNSDKVQGSVIDGQAPTFDAIAGGDYQVSRPLYFYVKKAHIGTVPGIVEYLNEFVSQDTIGGEGYLIDRGLIPLDDAAYSSMSGAAKSLSNLAM
ncbi:MAG: substrate-binding domain-containing protein [Acidiferrobacterales bacterium]|nr:substrate-binding domain-containing protein [Acidiferrobacterales bacterium]